jgi:hypothetical protein
MTDKSVKKLIVSLSEQTVDERDLFTLQHQCIKLQSLVISGKEGVVSLTPNMRLYINGHLFSNECTSFMLTQNFLAFVNASSGLQHLLFIYDLNRKLPQPQQGSDQPPQLA